MAASLRPLIAAAALGAAACSASNNIFLGRVQASVGSNTVVVTDCYRTSVPAPLPLPAEAGVPGYRFTPCKDADILIRGGELTVNGKAYGPIGASDGVLVDHGVVSIQRR